MRFRNLLSTTFLITPRSGVAPSCEQSDLTNDVDGLISLFEGAEFPVYLAGGVALALHVGHFYRNHKDFDIMVFSEDLPMLVTHLAGRGYLVGKRNFMIHLSSKHRLESMSRVDSSLLNRSNPEKMRLRALRTDGRLLRTRLGRNDYFDIFVLHRMEDGVVTEWERRVATVIPWEDFLPATKIREGSGLLLPNLKYKRHLPPETEGQWRDFEMTGLARFPEDRSRSWKEQVGLDKPVQTLPPQD